MNHPTPPGPILSRYFNQPLADGFNLFDGYATLPDRTRVRAHATVFLDARNTLYVKIEGPFELAAQAMASDAIQFQLDGFQEARGHVVGSSFGATHRATLSVSHLAAPPALTRAVEFVAVNSPEWLGDPVLWNQNGVRRGRLVFDADPFVITVDEAPERPEGPELKVKQFALTAAGRVERRDGTAFSTEDPTFRQALDALSWALTFAAGHWVNAPALLSATGTHAERWFEYTQHRVSRYNWGRTWHSSRHPRTLQEVFRGFFARLRDPIWAEPLRYVLTLYVDALSAGGTALGHLIWAQAALEVMAWTYFVQDPHTSRYTEKAFDRPVSASEKIRLLINTLHLPTAVPSSYADLAHFLAQLNPRNEPADAPFALVQARNIVVHPANLGNLQHLAGIGQFQASEVALGYLELAILRVLGVMAPAKLRWGNRNEAILEPLPWSMTSAR